MKRFTIIFLGVLLFYSVPILAQEKMLEKSFSIKFSFGFPAEDYGYKGVFTLPDEIRIQTTYGLELGSQWYFLKKEHFGLGLDINWLDLNYGKNKDEDPIDGTITFMTAEGSLLEFGPVVTFAVNDIIAIEAYYNLRPSYFISYYSEDGEDEVTVQGFSFLNGLGAGVRIKFIYVGYEYTFGTTDGNVKGYGEYEDIEEMYPKQEMSGVNSKLIIGVNF